MDQYEELLKSASLEYRGCPTAVVGVSADPTQGTEDWSDDFFPYGYFPQNESNVPQTHSYLDIANPIVNPLLIDGEEKSESGEGIIRNSLTAQNDTSDLACHDKSEDEDWDEPLRNGGTQSYPLEGDEQFLYLGNSHSDYGNADIDSFERFEEELRNGSDDPQTVRQDMARILQMRLIDPIAIGESSVAAQSSGGVPEKCRLADKLIRGDLGQTLPIEIYPRACHLITLKAHEGQGRAMKGPFFIKWLDNLVRKHSGRTNTMNTFEIKRKCLKLLHELEATEVKLTGEMSNIIIQHCSLAMNEHEKDHALDVMWRFLKALDRNWCRSRSLSKLKLDETRHTLVRNTILMLKLIAKSDIWDFEDILGVGSKAGDSFLPGHSRQTSAYKFPPESNFIEKKSPMNFCHFSKMLQISCASFPSHIDSFALIELSVVSHYFENILKTVDIHRNSDNLDNSPSPSCSGSSDSHMVETPHYSKDLFTESPANFHAKPGCFLWVAQNTKKPFYTKIHYLAQAICSNYRKLYGRSALAVQGLEQLSRHHASSLSVFVRPALGNIGDFEEEAQPNSTGTPKNPLFSHPESEPLFLQVASLTDLCLTLLGVSALNLKDRSEDLLKNLPDHNSSWENDESVGRNMDQQSGYSSGGETREMDDSKPSLAVGTTLPKQIKIDGSSRSSSSSANNEPIALYLPLVTLAPHEIPDGINALGTNESPRMKRAHGLSGSRSATNPSISNNDDIRSTDTDSRHSSMALGVGMQFQGDRCRAIKDSEDAQSFFNILLPLYKQLPERCILKSRAAHALGLLSSVMRKIHLAASFHLEAVLVLDRLPIDEFGIAPLVTWYGMRCLEKLGYALLSGKKYDYGILALERAIDCYKAVSNEDYDKLIRCLPQLTAEHGDMRRAFEYHLRFLRTAKQTNNQTEFVFCAEKLSELLMDEGWYSDAEQYLRVALCLHSGTPLKKVYIRERSDMANSSDSMLEPAAVLLPQSVSLTGAGVSNNMIPFLECSDVSRDVDVHFFNHEVDHSCFEGNSGHSSKRDMETTLSQRNLADVDGIVIDNSGEISCGCASKVIMNDVMDTQQYSVQMKLVKVLLTSLQYQKAARLLFKLLHSKLGSAQITTICLKLAICFYKMRRLSAAERWLERIQDEADKALKEIAKLIADTKIATNSRSQKFPSAKSYNNLDQGQVGTINRLRTIVRSVEGLEFLVLRAKCKLAADDPATALHWANVALAVCVDSRQAKHMTLGKLYYLRGRCLQHMVKRAWDDAIGSKMGTKGSVGFPVEVSACGSPPACLSSTSTDHYDPVNYYDDDGKSSKTSLRKSVDSDVRRASIIGPSEAEHGENECESLNSSKLPGSPGSTGSSHIDVGSARSMIRIPPWMPEKDLAAACEASFLLAQSHYRSADDAYYQGKCLARITEMHLSRVLKKAVIQDTMYNDKGEEDVLILKHVETHAAGALVLAGDIASPLFLILCLINSAELHWLQGRPGPAYQAWKEAQLLLNMTYLQQQDGKQYAANHLKNRSASTIFKPSLGTGAQTGLWGSNRVTSRGRSISSSPNRLRRNNRTISPPRKGGGWIWEQTQARGRANTATFFTGLPNKEDSESEKLRQTSKRPPPTPVGSPSLPTVLHAPSTMVQVYTLLSRIIRMSFMMAGVSLSPSLISSHSIPVVLASALPYNTHLLAGWQYLDSEVRQYQGLRKNTDRPSRRCHRRAQRSNTNTSTGGSSGSILNNRSVAVDSIYTSVTTSNPEKSVSSGSMTGAPLTSCIEGKSSFDKELNPMHVSRTLVPFSRHRPEVQTFPGCIVSVSGDSAYDHHSTKPPHRSFLSDMTTGKKEHWAKVSPNPKVFMVDSTTEIVYPPLQASGKGLNKFRRILARSKSKQTPEKRPGVEGSGSSPGVSSKGSPSPPTSRPGTPLARAVTSHQQKTPGLAYRARTAASPGAVSLGAESAASWRNLSGKKKKNEERSEQLKAAYHMTLSHSSKVKKSHFSTHHTANAALASNSFALVEEALKMLGTGMRAQRTAGIAHLNAKNREIFQCQGPALESVCMYSDGDNIGLSDEDVPFLPALATHSTLKSDESVIKTDEGVDWPTAEQISNWSTHTAAAPVDGRPIYGHDLKSKDLNPLEISFAKNSTTSKSIGKTSKKLRNVKSFGRTSFAEEMPARRASTMTDRTSLIDVDKSEKNEGFVLGEFLQPIRGKLTSGKSNHNITSMHTPSASPFAYTDVMASPQYRALWTSFGLLKQIMRKYSAEKVSLRDVRSMNIAIMDQIVQGGKSLGRSISRSDKDRRSVNGLNGPLRVPPNGSSVGWDHSPQPNILLQSREHSMLGSADVIDPKDRNQRDSNASLLETLSFVGSVDNLSQPLRSIPNISIHDGGLSGTSSGNTPNRNNQCHLPSGKRFTPSARMRSESCNVSNSAGTPALKPNTSIFDASLVASVGPRVLPFRLNQYPSTFSFLLHLENMYLYYAPAAGDVRVIASECSAIPPLAPTSDFRSLPMQPLEITSSDSRNQDDAGNKRKECMPSHLTHMENVANLGNRYDAVLSSIGNGDFTEPLPLIPRIDMEEGAGDKSMSVLIDVLTPQLALFIVTALLLEQPILLIANPGLEEDMMYVQTALLRLLRPFEWQYACISLCHQGNMPLLRHIIEAKEPFLIGTYPSVLNNLCPDRLRRPSKAPLSMSVPFTQRLPGGQSPIHGTTHSFGTPFHLDTSHISIVDLNLGIVHPSHSMEYAATCTMNNTYAPDADGTMEGSYLPSEISADGEKKDRQFSSESESTAASDNQDIQRLLHRGKIVNLIPGKFPPLPARYRHRLGIKIDKAVKGRNSKQNQDANTMRRSNSGAHLVGLVGIMASGWGAGGMKNTQGVKGNKSQQRRPSTASEPSSESIHLEVAECLRSEIFSILVSLLKPYHLFLHKPRFSILAESTDDPEFISDTFIGFMKSDLRLFLIYFLQTKMFKSFLRSHKKLPLAPPPTAISRTASFVPLNIRKGSSLALPSSPESLLSSNNNTASSPAGSGPPPLYPGTNVVRPGVNVPLLDLGISDTSQSPALSTEATPTLKTLKERNGTRGVIRGRVGGGSDSGVAIGTPVAPRPRHMSLQVPGDKDETFGGRRDLSRAMSIQVDEYGGRSSGTPKFLFFYRNVFEADVRIRMQAKVNLLEEMFHGLSGRLCLWVQCYFTYHHNDPTQHLMHPENPGAMSVSSSILGSPEGMTLASTRGGISPVESTASKRTRSKTSSSPLENSQNAGLKNIAEMSKPLKVKRRWCIVDATKVSYYRTRSKKYVKGFIPFEPALVSLVTPPFVAHTGQPNTTQKDFVTLVCKRSQLYEHRLPKTLVLRAEDVETHKILVRILKAKLTPREYLTKMRIVYNTDSPDEK